jgi:uncharacterized glyoxalase superfamily protein PhnB
VQTAAAKLSRIAPELPAGGLSASIEYYVQRLGFSLAVEMEGYAIVERDGVAIHLFEDAGRKHSAAGIHLFTPDLEELFAEFEAHGAKIVQPIERKPWGNREFRVKDEFGNELKFTEPVEQ